MTTSKSNPVTHRIPHDLDHKTAATAGRKVINGFLANHKQVKGRWASPTCCELLVRAAFNTLNGSVHIHETEIVFTIDHVPAIFAGFVAKAVKTIDTATKEAIAAAKKAKPKRASGVKA